MKTFDVAHIREQGVDLIIVPLDFSFGYKTQQEQNELARALETFAHNAGMACLIFSRAIVKVEAPTGFPARDERIRAIFMCSFDRFGNRFSCEVT